MLDDEPEDEALAEERVGRVEVDALEGLERTLAHVLRVGADGLGAERGGSPGPRPLAPERLVHVVVAVGERRLAVEVAEQPELLEVRDVREHPAERQARRRDLRGERVVRERLSRRSVASGSVPAQSGSPWRRPPSHFAASARTRPARGL